MSVRTAVALALLISVPSLMQAQGATASNPGAKPAPTVHPKVGNEMELGRKYTAWFFEAQYDSLWAHLSQEMRDDMGEPSTLAEYREQLAGRAGDEVEVVNEMVMMRNGTPQYWRTSNYSMMSEPVMLRWAIINGEIVGIGMNPASRAPATDPEQ
jgi:hypothetical protein